MGRFYSASRAEAIERAGGLDRAGAHHGQAVLW